MLRVWLAVGVALVASPSQANSLFDGDPVAVDAYPVVLTPARLKQSLQDVPASVTIVTVDMIHRYGITSVVDALRLVPGMQITQPSGNDFRVNYHGTNGLVPRRMNVMIDGVSAFQPAFARVDWTALPVNLEDIDRIEVTRGANSAAYGPNSMMAIVNIITKHPEDVERAFVGVRGGSDGSLGVVARIGAMAGATALRLTASRKRSSGYDSLSRSANEHDSSQLLRLNLRSSTKLAVDSSLNVDAGLVRGTKDEDGVERFQATYPDTKPETFYVSGVFTKSLSSTHEVIVRSSYWNNRVDQQWASCPPTAFLLPELFAMWQANPAYARAILAGRAPTGGSASDNALAAQAIVAVRALGARAAQPTCAAVDQNLAERRFDIELQDTLVLLDALRMVGGVGARRQWGESQTYLGGEVSNSIWYGFGNVELKATDWLNLNGGAYAERDSLSGRTSVSPRAAANARLSPHQAVRLVWTTGARTPDVQEQRANWTYSFADADPPLNGSTTGRFFQSARSPGGLRHERNRSVELGYLANVPTWGLMADVKVFEERLTDLISEKLQLIDYNPTNNGSVRLRGAEGQVRVQWSPDFETFAHYTYLDNMEASTPLERTQYSRHSGAAGFSHALGAGWSYALAYYGSSGDGLGETSFGRTDLGVSKAFALAGSKGSASLTLRRFDRKTTTNYRDIGSVARSTYDDRLQVFGSLGLSF